MIVLDTNVVSYIFNRDGRAEYYVERIRGDRGRRRWGVDDAAWRRAL